MQRAKCGLQMTEGEFKFAMEVEIALNKLPEPEYRQLMVEAMMVLATMVENDNCKIGMDNLIRVDSIVQEANRIFIADQVTADNQAFATHKAGTKHSRACCREFPCKLMCVRHYRQKTVTATRRIHITASSTPRPTLPAQLQTGRFALNPL